MAEIIRVDGTREKVNKELTLEFMQDVVGGWIEIVTFENGNMLVCNEEGKIYGLPENILGTKIWEMYNGPTDRIMGDIIMADPGEIK